MTSVPHSGAKSVTPGGSVAGGAHTKGPWVVTSDGHYVSPAADLTKIVALVFRPDTDSETERLDNARLIAASPAIYDYVASKADAGDEEALKIVEAIHASR